MYTPSTSATFVLGPPTPSAKTGSALRFRNALATSSTVRPVRLEWTMKLLASWISSRRRYSASTAIMRGTSGRIAGKLDSDCAITRTNSSERRPRRRARAGSGLDMQLAVAAVAVESERKFGVRLRMHPLALCAAFVTNFFGAFRVSLA
ncbi:unnamed protein product [Chondrus crispus]|uniref:Uncharacterized protein n=1 Tax=Chondrus crispus TaxID=2769 RepID=R7Q4M0_CHOCR|nr:unnamed protein product [Chondrus crispus]CDF33467.1 unnamed protein product [Chondrus crispus]|eukprot:XP_005713270.1 unnamed protein product [Chondrus crispus]